MVTSPQMNMAVRINIRMIKISIQGDSSSLSSSRLDSFFIVLVLVRKEWLQGHSMPSVTLPAGSQPIANFAIFRSATFSIKSVRRSELFCPVAETSRHTPGMLVSTALYLLSHMIESIVSRTEFTRQ